MIQSYNTINSALNQFANNHLSLKRYSMSFFEQIDNFSTSGNSFPILYVVPNDVLFLDNVDIMSYRVYCLDILQKDRSNESSILNQTLLILRDLVNYLRLDSITELSIENNPRAIRVNNFLVDFTVGWYIDLDINAPVETSDCSIPFSANFQLTGTTCEVNQTLRFLTCDTLLLCQNFIDLEAKVDRIVVSADTFTTGGSYSAGTLTLTRNDGDTIPITGFSTTIDTRVTGGTYTNGSAIFTNSTGGTFNVTGFFTGSTDIRVTGITNSNNTITLTNNTGGTISTIFNTVTGLTVTGGITANTISATTYYNLPIGGVYRNLWVPAGAMTPRVTNGAGGSTEETLTYDINLDYLLFDTTTQEGVQFTIAMPDEWDRNTIKFKFFWTPAVGAVTGTTVSWGISAVAISNDDPIDSAFGTSASTIDTVIAIGDLHVTSATTAVTVGGTPALGDMIVFQIVRDVANDNMAVDAKLIGISIQYKEGTTQTVIW